MSQPKLLAAPSVIDPPKILSWDFCQDFGVIVYDMFKLISGAIDQFYKVGHAVRCAW